MSTPFATSQIIVKDNWISLLLKQGDTKKDETAFQRPGVGGVIAKQLRTAAGEITIRLRIRIARLCSEGNLRHHPGLASTKRDTGEKKRKKIIFAE